MFQSIRGSKPRKNKFDLSHERKLSCNMGDLVPMLLEEVVPGDGFRVNSEVMMRLAPMLAPIMHRVNVFTHYFFVPNRIIWNEFEDFITGGEDGLQEPVAPYMTTTNLQAAAAGNALSKGKLADYLGLPTLSGVPAVDVKISALPFRAYQMIYNEYYRDQNVAGSEIPFSLGSGEVTDPTLSLLTGIRKRAWEKDYFTSCLPWAQRGDSVEVPGSPNYRSTARALDNSGDPDIPSADANVEIQSGTGNFVMVDGSQVPIGIENLDSIGVDINDLRRSNALQRWLELAARGGARYAEQIRNFFGVSSRDSRLQRPEYLGGGKQNIVISEVLQTSETSTTPQGNMSGHGVSVGSTNSFKVKEFSEHGWIIGIMSVLPRTAYQQGIDKMFTREDKFDYYFPQFAHLGEQAVLNKELFYDNSSSNFDGTFGYQSRYAEYKFRSSKVAGDFRDTLNYWHMGRIFSGQPVLDGQFIEADPTHRIFANTEPTDHKLWVQIFNRVNALRPMPYFGTPRL